MSGDLYFGCGSAEEEAPLWRTMLHRPVTRIIYWPFALPREACAAADGWLRTSLDALAVPYRLDTWESLADRSPTDLRQDRADLLFIGGGNTFRLLDQVKKSGFLDVVRGFWRNGGDYYGGSAGAVLACDDIKIADGHDPNDAELDDLTALGFVSGASILPHYTDDQFPKARDWADGNNTTLLGLPEAAGLHCRDGVAAVLGTGVVTRMSGGKVDRFSVGETFELVTR